MARRDSHGLARGHLHAGASATRQVRGQQIIELNPGDVVYAPHGEEYWHGASPDHFMTHPSITEGTPTAGRT